MPRDDRISTGFMNQGEEAMANEGKEVGEIVWHDLTVPNAAQVREFYQSVIGWEADEFKVSDYNDYVISTAQNKQTVAGLCHARGDNAKLPPQWIVYIKVHNLDASLAAAGQKGGKVIVGPKPFGNA